MDYAKKLKLSIIICAVILLPFVLFFAVALAPYIHEGLAGMLQVLPEITENPFGYIKFYDNTVKTVAVTLVLYACAVGAVLTSVGNYRRGEEHGSAKWGSIWRIRSRYEKRPSGSPDNRILSQNIKMRCDSWNAKPIYQRNANTLVVGGPGSWKTRGYVIPNLLLGNTHFVIRDPKGELLRAVGKHLESVGYDVSAVDLIHFIKSVHYNPLKYVRTEQDAQRIVTILFKATTPKGSTTLDPFWDNSAQMLLNALILLLIENEEEPSQVNFATINDLLREGKIQGDEDGGSETSPLDLVFEELRLRKPDSVAVKYYDDYRNGPNKTLQSIQLVLKTRLEKFNQELVAQMTRQDDLELDKIGEKQIKLVGAETVDGQLERITLTKDEYLAILQGRFGAKGHGKSRLPAWDHIRGGEAVQIKIPGCVNTRWTMYWRKVALFEITPDNDTSYNFLISMLDTQIIQELYRYADDVMEGRLDIPVHFMMDEFANVALPDDFEHIHSTGRSRNVFFSIIIQNVSQLKALFEKSWESIIGNSDTFLYMGGNEPSTFKDIAERLGSATIDNDSHGKNKGHNGSYSTNTQNAGRNLLNADEVGRLDNSKCILIVRGEKPVLDAKYNLATHPAAERCGAASSGKGIWPWRTVTKGGGVRWRYTQTPRLDALPLDKEELERYDAWLRQMEQMERTNGNGTSSTIFGRVVPRTQKLKTV